MSEVVHSRQHRNGLHHSGILGALRRSIGKSVHERGPSGTLAVASGREGKLPSNLRGVSGKISGKGGWRDPPHRDLPQRPTLARGPKAWALHLPAMGEALSSNSRIILPTLNRAQHPPPWDHEAPNSPPGSSSHSEPAHTHRSLQELALQTLKPAMRVTTCLGREEGRLAGGVRDLEDLRGMVAALRMLSVPSSSLRAQNAKTTTSPVALSSNLFRPMLPIPSLRAS